MEYGDLARLGNKISEALDAIAGNSGVEGLKQNGFQPRDYGGKTYWTAPTTAGTLATQAGIEVGLSEVGAGGVMTATAVAAAGSGSELTIGSGALAEFGGGVATGLGYGIVATLLFYMGYKLTRTAYEYDPIYWDGVIENIIGVSPHVIFGNDRVYIPNEIAQRAYEFAAGLDFADDDVYDSVSDRTYNARIITSRWIAQATQPESTAPVAKDFWYTSELTITGGILLLTRAFNDSNTCSFYIFSESPTVSPVITVHKTCQYDNGVVQDFTLTDSSFLKWTSSDSTLIVNGRTYYRFMDPVNRVTSWNNRSGLTRAMVRAIQESGGLPNYCAYDIEVSPSYQEHTFEATPFPTGATGELPNFSAMNLSTTGSPQIDRIAGAITPVGAGDIATSYPDWWRWQMTQNIGVDEAGNPVIDGTIDNVLVPVIPVADSLINDGTASDVVAVQDVGALTLEEILAMVGEAVADLIAAGTAAAAVDAIDEGANPQAPDPVDTGGTVVPIAVIGGALSDTGFVAIYHPTTTQLRSLNSWLWSTNFFDNIKKIFQDPMEAIISLHQIYATPEDAGTTTIAVGYLDSEVSSKYITNTVISLNCGSITIPPYYDNALDCNGFTEVDVFLPFIGFRTLNINDINNSIMNITYNIDAVTGACVALITVKKKGINAIVYTYNGNCAVQLPLSSANFNNMILGFSGAVLSGAAAAVTGSPVIGAGAAMSAMHSKVNIERSGNISSNVGAISPKKPYLVIRRPVAKMAYRYQHFMGFPSSSNVKLSSCSGFTQVQEVILNELTATETERTELSNILKEGVIF